MRSALLLFVLACAHGVAAQQAPASGENATTVLILALDEDEPAGPSIPMLVGSGSYLVGAAGGVVWMGMAVVLGTPFYSALGAEYASRP